jgi:hypothetical protein
MLRASDGRWQQDVSLFVKVSTGTPDLIEGKLVDIIKPNATFKILVDRRQYVEVEVDRVVQLSPDTYEIFIDRKYYGNIDVGDVIRYNTIFAGTVVSTTSKVTIVDGGTGFKTGQLFEIKNGTGVRSIVKVTRVDSNGTIKACEFIKFGIGYATDFTISINASQDYFATAVQPLLSTVLVNGQTVAITETTNGNAEQGYINKADYAYSYVGDVQEFYMDGSYAGSTLGTFTTQAISQVISSVSKQQAILKIQLGSQANYPGYYTSNAGFLSDSIFIQDSRYYQAFSYVLKIDERLASYKTAVRTMVHPAGTALFGEYQISSQFNIGTALKSIIQILAVHLADSVSVSDPYFGVTIDFYKALTESVLMSADNYHFDITKSLSDSIDAPSDSTTLLTTKALSESVTYSESYSFAIGKPLSDTLSTPTDSATISTNKGFTETVTASESASLLTTKYLTETITDTDSGVVYKNPYSDGSYFDITTIYYNDEVAQVF